jgi:hypothetical protein
LPCFEFSFCCQGQEEEVTPHFLRPETKRYRFFLGYGFQDLDGETDRHVAFIYKIVG